MVLPFAETVSARGVSPKRVIVVSGVPPSVAPRLLASKTQTSARPTPGRARSALVHVPAGHADTALHTAPLFGPPAHFRLCSDVFCPRCAVVMNARLAAQALDGHSESSVHVAP